MYLSDASQRCHIIREISIIWHWTKRIHRPGFGTSTAVSLAARVPNSLAAVRAVCEHLEVKHISLVSASSGFVYLLNAITQLRDLLHPTRPYVAALVPWVHPKYSNTTLLNTASKLPEAMIGSIGAITKFVANQANPAISWSGGVFGQAAAMFKSSPQPSEPVAANEAEYQEYYGMSKAVKDEVDKLCMKWLWADNPT